MLVNILLSKNKITRLNTLSFLGNVSPGASLQRYCAPVGPVTQVNCDIM